MQEGDRTGILLVNTGTPDEPRPHAVRKYLSLIHISTDLVKDRFGEAAVRFGHALRNEENTTGSSSKNPADYK